MKTEVWRGQNSARFIYFRYKDSPYFSWLILSIIILVCFLLIFQIIIPQGQNWFSIRDEAVATRQRIDIIKKNTVFMSELNKNVVEGERQLAIRALPVEKDFGGIINAVTIAALKSGVSVDDFSFNLGRVTSASAESSKQPEASEPTTKLSLSLSGDRDRIKSFISEISEKLPISQIDSIDSGDSNTIISLFFYSKAYVAPRITEEEPIRPLTPENNILYGKLLQWDVASSYNENEPKQMSSSDVPLF